MKFHLNGVLAGLHDGGGTNRTAHDAEGGPGIGLVRAFETLSQNAAVKLRAVKGNGVGNVPSVFLVHVAATVLHISVDEGTTDVEVAVFTLLVKVDAAPVQSEL